jgi:hypothetical protein
VNENVFARLAADKAVAFGVIEPLYCSLFCHDVTGVPFNQFTLEGFGGTAGRLLAVEARAAHDRLGLTHDLSLRGNPLFSKEIAGTTLMSCCAPRINSPRLAERGPILRQDASDQSILNLLNLEDTPP